MEGSVMVGGNVRGIRRLVREGVSTPRSRDVRGGGAPPSHLINLEWGVDIQFHLFGYVKVVGVRPISGTSVSQCVAKAGAPRHIRPDFFLKVQVVALQRE